jgi:hypothetical protein
VEWCQWGLLCVGLCVRRDWYFQNCFRKVPIPSDAQIQRVHLQTASATTEYISPGVLWTGFCGQTELALLVPTTVKVSAPSVDKTNQDENDPDKKPVTDETFTNSEPINGVTFRLSRDFRLGFPVSPPSFDNVCWRKEFTCA